MLTSLDEYVQWLASLPVPDAPKATATRMAASQRLAYECQIVMARLGEKRTEKEHWDWFLAFARTQALLGFLIDRDAQPLAIQLTPELASQLVGAHAPANEEVASALDRHAFLYFDIPQGSLVIGRYELLGALVWDGRTAFVPLRSGDGSYRFKEIREGFDLDHALCMAFWRAEVGFLGSCWKMGYGRIDSLKMEPADEAAHDLELATREIEMLIDLALLYQRHGTPEQQSQLPRMAEKATSQRSRKKERAKHKKFSLFRVVRLEAPPDRFGRPENDFSRGGWKLGIRTRVRGHFRLQPHGPSGALRRLQWIAAHERGPADGERKIDLLRLPSSSTAGSSN